MRTYQVYTVTNTVTGNVYLAYTLNGVKNKKSPYFTTNKSLYDDLQRYGINQFIKLILGNFSTKNDAKIFYRNKLVELKKTGVKLYNEMCSYGYVYLTTNKVNGMKYIGQHRISGNPTQDNSYIGSGAVFRHAVRKYGIENFSKEILCECDSEDQLNQKEIELIEKYDAVRSKQFYNIAKGGSFGDSWTGKSYYKKRKFRARIAESNHTRKLDPHRFDGNKNPAFGHHWYKDVANRKQYYLCEDDPLIAELKLVKGLFRTKKHNQKIGNALRGKKKTYAVHAKGKIAVSKDGHVKFILPSEFDKYAEDGYVRGNAATVKQHYVFMNDGIKNYRINTKQVNHYLALGFKIGLLRAISE